MNEVWGDRSIIGLRTGYGLQHFGSTLLFSAVPFVLTTIITWLILRKIRIKPWVLIFLTLPIYIVMSVVVGRGSLALGVVFQLMVR